MATGTAQVIITGIKTLLPFGQETIGPLVIQNGASGPAITVLNAQSGANTVTVPTDASYKGCVIQPPAGNVATITLKGVTGDTGIALHPTDPTYLALAAGVISFVLTLGASNVLIQIQWV